MQRHTLFLICILALVSLSLGPCDESLPTYQAPDKIFEGTIQPSYILSVVQNVMSVQLIVRNIFDETFQAPGILKGSIEIVSVSDPSIRKTFAIGPSNVIRAPGYDRNSGMLLIDPQDTIRLGIQWDFKADDNGKDLRTQFFRYIVDSTCDILKTHGISRGLAYTEDFILRGELKIYDQRAPVYFGPVRYSLCFVSRYVTSNCCPPIMTSEHCGLYPENIHKPYHPDGFDPEGCPGQEGGVIH
ncbi:MAG: hypothetical protein HY088_04255 [Ignavibacteriales bacterium]|nr:hypothetical protein [Ignavibacteriales bacterium]